MARHAETMHHSPLLSFQVQIQNVDDFVLVNWLEIHLTFYVIQQFHAVLLHVVELKNKQKIDR